MSLSACTILISQRTDRAVSVSRELGRQLQLATGGKVSLRLGSKSVSLPVRMIKLGGAQLILPANAAAELKMPGRIQCLIKSSGRELRIGPLIGILTGASGHETLPFGTRTGFVREFMDAGAGRAVFFAFAPHNVNWRTETVTGYFPSDGGRWVRRTVPLPDVVYNRLASRSAEKSLSISDFKERFIRRSIPLFNWSFFDKWDVYRLLEDEDEAGKHVPESNINPSPQEIRRMLEKHKFVYLKPTAGSLGIGIYRLTYHPQRGYFARFRRGGANALIRFSGFDGLMSVLKRHNVRFQNYVVQQGIRLIELDNCPIDFRFHMTKNGLNKWVVAGIGAKKAGRGSVTTHVRTGGQLMTPEQVLRSVFGGRGEQLLSNAKEVAIRLAEAIERNYSRPLAELGFDLGIDEKERIWMFEANAKPGRSIFKHPSLKSQGKAAINNLIEHCNYLSLFRARRDG